MIEPSVIAEQDHQEPLLQLLGAVRRSGHDLNNVLTAAHCLVDLLEVPQGAARSRKYSEDLRMLLGEIAAINELLRREGNAALNSGVKLPRADSSGNQVPPLLAGIEA